MNVLKRIYHYFLAWSGGIRFGHPSRNLFVIGVTGTKGKSTTLELLRAVLAGAGKNVAVLSSLHGADTNTMPGRWAIQKFLARAVETGAGYALVEVTSEGVRQHRHRFVDWDAAAFLNLHPEHIESHGSFEKYRDAKVAFFSSLKHSAKRTRYFFINAEDDNAVYFEEAARAVPNGKLVLWRPADAFKLLQDLRDAYDADWMKADFNVENVAAALAVARELGVGEAVIREALGGFTGVPGRMQFVQKEPFAVVVDYAHTPDSLEAAYRNIRQNYGFRDDSQLIAILGSAGGGRDKWKRPELGKIAASYADIIVLTSEDPYDEDPGVIIAELRRGIESANVNPEKVYEIPDRTEAIAKALSLATAHDFVVLTGMGSQKQFHLKNGTTVPWDEVGIVRALLTPSPARRAS